MNARILNVDDHDAGRYARTRFLSRAGFVVEEAATGEQALACLRDKRPDIVLLDINLPDIDGFEICRRIKSDPKQAVCRLYFSPPPALPISTSSPALSMAAIIICASPSILRCWSPWSGLSYAERSRRSAGPFKRAAPAIRVRCFSRVAGAVANGEIVHSAYCSTV